MALRLFEIKAVQEAFESEVVSALIWVTDAGTGGRQTLTSASIECSGHGSRLLWATDMRVRRDKCVLHQCERQTQLGLVSDASGVHQTQYRKLWGACTVRQMCLVLGRQTMASVCRALTASWLFSLRYTRQMRTSGGDRCVCRPRKLLILKITVGGVEGQYKYNPYPSIWGTLAHLFSWETPFKCK
jgi:hypothetical protein